MAKPRDPRRAALRELAPGWKLVHMSSALVAQVAQCKDDTARRLLLMGCANGCQCSSCQCVRRRQERKRRGK